MAEKTIATLYGGEVATLMLDDNWYAGKETPGEVAPDLIVGVELEIEHWNSRAAALGGWRYTEDGSLRNNGRELISNPIKTKFLRGELDSIFRTHQITDANYSERCSTHVHMNVQNYTITQLKSLCMLYQIVERLLFDFIGNERKDNIFCVPWYESGVTPRFVDKMTRSSNAVMGQWVKYTALNLLPVVDKGTVEFRHLHGTCNTAFIMDWVSLIARMHLYAQKMSPKDLTSMVLSMNTVSNYDMFLGDVFGEQTHLLTRLPHYKEALSVGVVDTKLMMLKPPKAVLKTAEPRNIEVLREALNNPDGPVFRWEGGRQDEPALPVVPFTAEEARLRTDWEALRRARDNANTDDEREAARRQMRAVEQRLNLIRRARGEF